MTKSQIGLRLGMALLISLIVYAMWQWSGWRQTAQAGSAYAARIVCSCRYVEGRSMESCQQDVALDASAVRLSEQPDQKAIIGQVPLLGHARAQFRPGYGCLMDRP